MNQVFWLRRQQASRFGPKNSRSLEGHEVARDILQKKCENTSRVIEMKFSFVHFLKCRTYRLSRTEIGCSTNITRDTSTGFARLL